MSRRRMTGLAATLVGLVLTACVIGPTPTATVMPATPTAVPSASAVPSATTAPTPVPTPAFALELPGTSDARAVAVTVEPAIDADGGELLVTVENTADERIDEIVLRWATDLDTVLFLAPFEPSDDRIRDGGPPLVQQWTKWVVGPGERGEPAGTTSLGYGPILAGTTLAIAILVERRDPDPIAFDLQVLSGNDVLQLADGSGPAVIRVEVP
jgi:hypothetical protein